MEKARNHITGVQAFYEVVQVTGKRRKCLTVFSRTIAISVMIPTWFLMSNLTILFARLFGWAPTWESRESFLEYWPEMVFIGFLAVFSILWTLALWRLERMAWRWRQVFGVLALLSAMVFLGGIIEKAITTDVSIALMGSAPFLVSAVYFLVVAYLFLSCRASGKGAQDSR